MEDILEINQNVYIDALKKAYQYGYTVPIEEKNKVIDSLLEYITQKNKQMDTLTTPMAPRRILPQSKYTNS